MKCYLAKIGFFQIHTEAITVVSLLSHDLQLLAKVFVLQRSLSQLPRDCLTREKCVFSVLYSRCDSFFKHLDISLALTLFEPFSTQITFTLTGAITLTVAILQIYTILV